MLDLKNVEKKYRPLPFWSWNTNLDKKETARQMNLMNEAGIGGCFMHARGGLTTEYMGEEWFENVSVTIEKAKEYGMQPWAYDENGWPSGFGNGYVNGLGIEYQQKYLRYDEDLNNQENLICVKGNRRFFFEVNPYYVDTLNDKVTEKFIAKIYKPYYEKYQNDLQGFFTDEPQISRNGIPWSFILPDEYEKEYGQNLLEHLDELFFETGDYENTRTNFWRLVTMLFSKNFMKKIYDWCVEHQYELTGHLVLEETLETQLTTNGACMPHYEYFTMPGMDWLGRDIFDCLTPLQVSSVAHQLGKKEILSETFALCGHNVGLDALKAIYQWQMVHGITRLCQHLQGYSLGGLRKRDFPPAMYYQQPWWPEYQIFNEAMSRIGKILSEGDVRYNTLLLHNQSSAWKCFNNADNGELEEYNAALIADYRILSEKHILFHFGDEIIMERHAHVEGNVLVIGKQRYSTIVVPKNRGFLAYTEKLLKEFAENGGIITTADAVQPNDICNSSKIIYTEREFDGYKVYYFINNHPESVLVDFRQGSQMIDIETGELMPFCGQYEFDPYDSLILFDDGSGFASELQKKELKQLDLSGEWDIVDFGQNILTLDTCDVYFDNELAGKKENIPDVLYMALVLKRKVHVCCKFTFQIEDVPEGCYLVCETPEKFQWIVNGQELFLKDEGYFVDKSFRKISLDGMLKKGENVISANIYFAPEEKIYEDLEKAYLFESEKNKLTFGTEFEPIYIIGKFSVETKGAFEKLKKNAVRYNGSFVVKEKKSKLLLKNIEQQGFPFFSGRITVRKKFVLTETDYKLQFSKKGINAICIKVNGIDCRSVMWGHLNCDISHALRVGVNVIEITIVNNLRNMLGPHHLPQGESWFVCPQDFYRRGNVWTDGKAQQWNEGHCLAEVSLE